MKFRTDFVTNSSSSSFSVVVGIQSKDGKNYSFKGDSCEYREDTSDCSLGKKLENLYIMNDINKINEEHNIKFKLEKVDEEERNARIENVSVGDPVIFVKIPGKTKIGWHNELDYAIDVRNSKGSLGVLSCDAVALIKDVFESDQIELKATVSSVTPLSKRRKKNAKEALISISIEAKEKPEGRVITIDHVHELAQFLMDEKDGYYEADFWDRLDELEKLGLGLQVEELKKQKPKRDSYIQKLSEQKEKFISDVSNNIDSINDIEKIYVDWEYEEHGGDIELIADEDEELCELAKKVNSTTGDEQEKALAEMLTYIRTLSENCDEEDLEKSHNFCYKWDGDKADLLALAERLCSGLEPDYCDGRVHKEIDLIRGVLKQYNAFNLR